jgi:hypothetical protein
VWGRQWNEQVMKRGFDQADIEVVFPRRSGEVVLQALIDSYQKIIQSRE